jgi:uncharacterized protein YndB with AHSA1/START domain
MADQVSVDKAMAAPPDVVWKLIAEVTRMGEWSPETASCEWLGGTKAPVVGARFRGRNAREGRKWSTTCQVVAAEPGRSFAFDVRGGPFRVARWEYRIEPDGAGSKVTETWTDQRGRLVAAIGKAKTGVEDRATHNRQGMVQTLDRLAAAAEAEAART